MAATTVDRAVAVKRFDLPLEMEYPVAASTLLYGGSIAKIDASGNVAVPAGSSAAAHRVVFIPEQVDNASGSAGDLDVKVQMGVIVPLVGAALTAADVGKTCYAVDNQTITLTAGTAEVVGVIFEAHPDHIGDPVGSIFDAMLREPGD